MGDYDREAMLETFIYEMGLLLEQLENISVQADSGYDSSVVNEIFRIMHTIKGSAAMMMYNGMSSTAHAIEDLFYYLRENNPVVVDYPKITDLTLEVTDFIKGELEKLHAGNQPDGEAVELIDTIENYVLEIKGEAKPAPKASAEVKATQDIPDAIRAKYSKKGKSFHAYVEFESDCEMENIRAYSIIHSLEPYASFITHDPQDLINEDSIDVIRSQGFHVYFQSEHSYKDIQGVFMQSIFLKDLKLEEILNNQDENCLEATLRFQDGCEMENVRAYGVVHNLEKDVESIDHIPEDLLDEKSIIEIRKHGLKLFIVTSKSRTEIEEILESTIYLESLEVSEVEIGGSSADSKDTGVVSKQNEVGVEKHSLGGVEMSTGNISSGNVAVPEEFKIKDDKHHDVVADAAQKKVPVQSAISVSVGKLDQLLNLVGELVISEAMVTQNPDLAGLELESFTKEARQLHKIINDVQDTVMSMRMVPLSPTFFKMHRIVRDMCKNLGKEVNLEVIGEDTEVDKNIIEHISDPLMHIIRNSVDHGIETPEERIKVGKKEKGTVTLEAKNSGGDVLIIIKDDGQGLIRDKIVAKALRNGLLTKPEEEYTDKEIFSFILLPGFSTNEQVTQYSGRGVGMDVVTSNLEAVGGTVLVDSVPGEGSVFTLKIPLTLAIIEGMIIKIGGTKYTIPIISIEKSLKATNKDLVRDPSGNEMITIKHQTYNFVRLNREFALNEGVDDIEDGIVMMLENGEQKICVLVDELIGEQQVVVKSIPKYIKKPRGISGCTLLGNGEISLIIDVAGFFDR